MSPRTLSLVASILVVGCRSTSPTAAPDPAFGPSTPSPVASNVPAASASVEPVDAVVPSGPVSDPPVATVDGVPIPWESFTTVYELKIGRQRWQIKDWALHLERRGETEQSLRAPP